MGNIRGVRDLHVYQYEAHWISKLSDSESKAEETRVWLEFALRCGYISEAVFMKPDEQ